MLTAMTCEKTRKCAPHSEERDHNLWRCWQIACRTRGLLATLCETRHFCSKWLSVTCGKPFEKLGHSLFQMLSEWFQIRLPTTYSRKWYEWCHKNHANKLLLAVRRKTTTCEDADKLHVETRGCLVTLCETRHFCWKWLLMKRAFWEIEPLTIYPSSTLHADAVTVVSN